ncbi:MAG: DNA adenine methylase [Bacillota bacterium]
MGLVTAVKDIRPPLKWAGGKRWLVPHLQAIWEQHKHRRLVEPLCGGLAVTLGLMPEKALLNDINPHLINFYSWLKKGLIAVLPMENNRHLYYSHREKFNSLIADGQANTVQAAELFYYLNRTGYNGLCRFNKQGGFNVPFGRYSRINYIRDFSLYQDVFAAWEFMSGDFGSVPIHSNDFVYADPPYDVEFTQYTAQGFGWNDQVRLATWLSQHSGPVVLSNQATERIVDMYQSLGFTLTLLEAPRMINCTGDRTPAKEVLATKGV